MSDSDTNQTHTLNSNKTNMIEANMIEANMIEANMIDYIKNFKFYKWCNCERINNKITVKCYDYPLEAIAAHEKEVSQPNYNYHNKETIL
jgi:hypothetical protein